MKKYLLLLLIPIILLSGCSSTSSSIALYDNSQPINTLEHEKVSSGLTSRFWDSFSVDGGSSRFIHIKIDENNLYFKDRDFSVAENDGEIFYKVFVDCNITDNGDIRNNIHNSNTLFSIVDNTTIYLDPTFTSCEYQIDNLIIPTGFKTGYVSSDDFDWVYKANSSIIIEIENKGTKTIDTNIRYKWFVE